MLHNALLTTDDNLRLVACTLSNCFRTHSFKPGSMLALACSQNACDIAAEVNVTICVCVCVVERLKSMSDKKKKKEGDQRQWYQVVRVTQAVCEG